MQEKNSRMMDREAGNVQIKHRRPSISSYGGRGRQIDRQKRSERIKKKYKILEVETKTRRVKVLLPFADALSDYTDR